VSDGHATSRRDFVKIAGGAALGVCLAGPDAALQAWQGSSSPALRFGYAAITWEGNDVQAIDDVAAVGFKGIQLRSSAPEKFGDAPGALRDLLQKRQLTMVALSSGNLRIDPAVEAEELSKHTRNAKFVKDVGGLYLQIIDERPKRAIVPADYKRLGVLMTELGKRTADLGIPLVYHHHMNSLGERPEEVAPILEAADPKLVRLLLDVAHYQQGGGDPIKAIRQYHDRIQLLHIKDVVSPAPGATGDVSRSYQFVELGRGKVDLKGVFAAIKEVGFRGWAIVELDKVPDPSRTPKDCAIISRDYLRNTLGFTI
jgi:inosose dehydratase